MFALPRRYVGILCIGLSAMLLSACQPQNTPQDHFMTQLAKHCGKAYVGQVVSDNLQDTAWASSRIIMHVRNCSAQQIEIPLHVGDDRSRTWVITRLDDQLSLQHVHVHEDGSPDEVSPYGGQTADKGSSHQQAFPVDQASQALFREHGLAASVDNVWTLTFIDESEFSYKLTRPNREFEIRFDLTEPVELPPKAWGYQE